jgi:hypothetical protein
LCLYWATKESTKGTEKSISVFSVPFSVAESLGSPPSLERHYNMRFSISGSRLQWFEEAEHNGLPEGNGKCARQLRQLAKKDQRKLKEVTENRENVRHQLGKQICKNGLIGLAPIGKPRVVKGKILAWQEQNSWILAISFLAQSTRRLDK